MAKEVLKMTRKTISSEVEEVNGNKLKHELWETTFRDGSKARFESVALLDPRGNLIKAKGQKLAGGVW